MSDSYKKYIDKAKKQKADGIDHNKKNLDALKKSFIKFLQEEAKEKKYADGSSDVKQAEESQQQRFQAKDYFGKDDGADSGETLGRFSDGSLKVDSNSESPNYYNNGSPKVGSGKRFQDLKEKLSHKKRIKDPEALAASIGREKYGNAKMNAISHKYAEGTNDVSDDNLHANIPAQTLPLTGPGKKPDANDPRYGGTMDLGKILDNLPADKKYAFGTPQVPMYKPPMAVMPAHMPAVPKFTGGVKHMKRFADGATPDEVSNNAPIDPGVIETFKKYFNTPSPTPSPTPSLEDKYKKIREDNAKQFSGKSYNEGTEDAENNQQSLDEKVIEAGENARRDAEKKVRDSNKQEQPIDPNDYIRMNNPQKFDEGTPSVPPTTPSYPIDQQKIKDAQQSMRDAFHFARGSADIPAHQVFHKYMALFGGLPKVPNAHHMPNPLAEDKVPLNIPRGGKIKFPKRLKTVSNIEGFAEGTDNVTDNAPEVDDSDDAMVQKYRDLGMLKGPTVTTKDQANITGSPSASSGSPTDKTSPVIPADLGPYPGEDEEADKTSDESPDAEIQKAADDTDESEDSLKEEPKKKRVINLPEDTISKEDALKDDEVKEDKDKELEDEYKGEEEKADKEAVKAKDLEESENDKKPSDKVEDKEDAKEVLEKPNIQQNNGPMQKLLDAQNQQRNSVLFNQLGKITDRMGASMGHFQPQNQGIYDTNIEHAGDSVKNLEQQIAMEKYDPNSKTSQAFREYMTKFGGADIKALGNISMAQAEAIAPYAVKDFEAKQASAAKAQDLKARNEEKLQQTKMILDQRAQQAREHNELMAQFASQKNESAKEAKQAKQDAADQAKKDKIDAKDVDRVDKMNKAINAEMANGRSAFGIAAKNRQAVDNAKALINGETNLDNIDNRQLVETARSLDKVLSGGNATISGSEHLTPETARTWLAKKMEFITNQRQGAGASSFLKTMSGTLDREGNQADKQILKAQSEFMGPYKGLEKNDKDSRSYQNYVNTLKSNHLDALLPKDEQEEKPSAPPANAQAKQLAPNEVKRITKDGRTAIFDSETKKFLRYE